MLWQNQDKDAELNFLVLSQEFKTNEATINTELIQAQGKVQEMGGYYQPILL
jgi:isocitrate dehydrogenase